MRIITRNRSRWLTALTVLAVCQAVYVAGAGALPATAPEQNASESPPPGLAAGAKPEPQKILDEAQDLTRKGQYEEALQRLLWYFNHALEYDAGQTGVRLSFALSDWIELGRRYPKARQALVEIRQRDQRAFAEGHGYFDLFMEFSAINRYLQDEEPTYTLFKQVHQTDPDLARQCFRVAEPILVKHGDYELCLKYLGEPQAAFDRIRQDRERSKQLEQHQAELFRQMRERMAKTTPNLAGSPALMLPKTADDRFVRDTRQLVEILIGAGRKAGAEKLRKQALKLVDDPRLKSAVTDAEEAVRIAAALPKPPPVQSETHQPAGRNPVLVATNPPGQSASAELWSPPGLGSKPAAAGPALKPEASLPMPPGLDGKPPPASPALDPTTGLPLPVGINPASGRLMPAGAAPSVNPALNAAGNPLPPDQAGTAPSSRALIQRQEEPRELMRQHRYEEALQCYLAYYQHAREAEAENLLIPVLFDWIELGRRYPKARQALIEIRDRETRKFAEGGGYSELFRDVAAINERLGDEDATRTLFLTIDQRDPALARQCYNTVEPLLVRRGEYALCLRYLGNPQEAFDRSRSAYQVMKASHQRLEENLAAAYRRRAAEHPDQPVPKPRTSLHEGAKYGDDYFVQKTCRLIEILVGTRQEATADKIRKQALALINDPRLKSSLSDAKQRLAKK